MLLTHRTQIADLAVKSRLPAIYLQTEYTEAGGLMYYGANFLDLQRRAATYVDKILEALIPPNSQWSNPRSSSSSST
jgi:putative ABC transport system substrate-binding protein